MSSFISRYATPLITGLFVVSLISGVALFFHFGSAWFHGMHEWLSMVLILPFALHIWKNWRAFVNYFRRPAMAVSLVASLAMAAVFVVPVLTSGGGRSGPPEMAAVQAMQKAPLSSVAPLFGSDGEAMVATLRAKGYEVFDATQSINAIAEASGKSTREILVALPIAD